MENNFTLQKLPICDLALWDENARFPDKYFLSDEIELIKYFITKSEFKIQSLAEEIVKDYDLPQLERLVVLNSDGNHIVLEGNRRLTAYKLLINPELINDSKLIAFFKHLKSKINITDKLELDCLVTDQIEDGFRYIDRKHANNNNEVNWQDVERAHYSVRRGSRDHNEKMKVGITKVVRSLAIPEPLKDQVLGKKFVTNFFRIVSSGPSREKYGLSMNDKNELDIKSRDFNDELKIIVHNVLNGEDFSGNPINSRSLNKVKEIKKYINSIKKDDIKKVDKDINNKVSKDIFGDEIITIGGGRKKIYSKSTHRDYLIPNTCNLFISEKKINNIYRELRDDLLLNDSKNAVPNAVAVLFRVFLEISIDYFLEKVGQTVKKETKLSGKITKCTELLEEKGIANSKQLKNIRKVATDQSGLLSIQNFHDYVHSYRMSPSSNDLKIKWDNLEEFFQILWDYNEQK